MSRVEIYRLENDGTQKVVATCSMEEEKVVCTGDEKLVKHLETNGIVDNSVKPPQQVYPKDGTRFLDNLKSNFSSAYLRASEVKD